ncbi:MAG TPA: tetratricopeptide repeat protein, partial [Gemmatimonadales bacterium]|nr:tetratricopeptide repeat protein [Gemmatimonadales bacterium]
LTQAEPLYWDYGWRLLDERTRKDPRILTAAAARELTRRQGARYYIDGWVVLDADSLRVLLALHDAAGPDVPVTRQASARVGERTPTQLGLQAAVALLPSLLSHPVDLSPLTDRRPVAIAEFLLGEVEYFASRFGSALQHYQRALDTDSSLALAAVKGAQAAGWDDRLDESQVLADQALTHADLLPRRYVLMARGIHDYARGQADSATAWLTQATRMAPNWAEAWTGLGEVYYHLLPDASPIDSLAEGAFRRAYALDPSFTPPIYHLVQIAIRRSRLSEARDLLAQYQRIAPDTTVLQPLQLMLGCARRGMTRAAWVEAARQAAAAVTDAAVWLSSSPEYMGCAEQAFRAVMQDSMAHPNARAQAYFALQSLLAGSGRAAETRALASSEPGSRSGGWYFLLDALVDSAFDRDAAPVVEKAGEDYQAMSPGKLWFLGMWESHRADTVRLGRIAAQLTRKADSSGTARDRLLAEAIGAHLTLARGDTAAALDRLTRLRPVSGRTALAWLPPDGLGFERLVQARIHLQRGDAESALRVAAVFDSPAPVPFTLFRRASLTVRRAAAEAAGQRALARHFDEVLNQMPRVPKLP